MVLTSSLLEVLAWLSDAVQHTLAATEIPHAGARTAEHARSAGLAARRLARGPHARASAPAPRVVLGDLAACRQHDAGGDDDAGGGGRHRRRAAHQLGVRPVPDGFDRGRDSSERVRGERRPAPYHAGLDPGLHPRMRDLRRCAGDAGTARGTHGAGARRRCARRAGLHRPGSLLPESARAADRRVPFAGVDGRGAVRTAHRRRVRHRRAVALRLLVVRAAGPGARGGVASAARPSGTRSGLAGATHPGRAAGVRRRSDPRDLVRGRGRLDNRFRRAPAGGMHVPVVVRRARFRRLPPLKAASRPCDRSRPSGRLRHCDDVHPLPVHDVVHCVRPDPVDPAVCLDGRSRPASSS